MTTRPLHETARVHIRWMIRRDMPFVLEIESASSPAPWGEEPFLALLRQGQVIGMVAERGERIVGWMIYELHKDRLELLRLAVAPDCRREGVGRALVAKLVVKLSAHRRTRIDLACRETNLAGQRWLKALGFRASAVDRERYEDTGEDAYLFALAPALDDHLPLLECHGR